jgi:hypothetical protein
MADMQYTLSFLRRELAGKTIEQKVVLFRFGVNFATRPEFFQTQKFSGPAGASMTSWTDKPATNSTGRGIFHQDSPSRT